MYTDNVSPVLNKQGEQEEKNKGGRKMGLIMVRRWKSSW